MLPVQVRAVLYHPDMISEELYQAALTRVDAETHNRIERFYRREDACRTLIGMLLIRLLLHERGIASRSIMIAKTPEGKPYIANQRLGDQIGFNITHDNALISLGFAPGVHDPPAFSIGIDVMKAQIPARDTLDSFIEIFEEQLTALEKAQLTPDVPCKERICRFYWMWTVKEAYTKALGLGLGFDFRRVEFDVVEKQVRIDGQIPKGWQFTLFTVPDGDDVYKGAVAHFVGGDSADMVDKSSEKTFAGTIWDAESLLRRAIDELPQINIELDHD